MAGMENEDTIESGVAKKDYLRVACALQDRLRDGTGGTGDCASDGLREILEVAAQEFGIERDDQVKCTDRGEKCRKISREKSTMTSEKLKQVCDHSCNDHLKSPNPKIGGALPRELLQLVFARLPVHEIGCLQFLSKEWRQIVSSADFHRVCNEVYPKLVCFISRVQRNRFWVRVLDPKQKWHIYKIVVDRPEVDWTATPVPRMNVACEDGGLVCFFTTLYLDHSQKKDAPRSWFYTVVDPLTRTYHHLPPLFDLFWTFIVRMQVDRETNSFKVFVFATMLAWRRNSWGSSGVATHLYDSFTGEWTTTYGSDVFPSEDKRVEYSFATGRLFNIDDDYKYCRRRDGEEAYVQDREVYGEDSEDSDDDREGYDPDDDRERYEDDMYSRTNSTFYNNRLFVLQLALDGPANDEVANQSRMYYIEEFHWESAWVKDKTYRCEPFEHPPKSVYRMQLHACNGFLMVIACVDERYHKSMCRGEMTDGVNKRFGNHCAWLYDLSTQKWTTLDLPHWPGGGTLREQDNSDGKNQEDLMFEPQWGNIVPKRKQNAFSVAKISNCRCSLCNNSSS